MEQTYEYAILSLAELESQKKQINSIANINNNITKNISISDQILTSFNSFFKKIKLKMDYNFYTTEPPLQENKKENKIETNLGNILDINKKINKEIENQNNTLKNLNTNIQNNNYNIKHINQRFKPLLDG